MNINLIRPHYVPNTGSPTKLAVLAHAYKPLGGSSNDYPLRVLARRLCAAGYFVILYDREKTTLTGDSEVAELEQVLRSTISTHLSEYPLSKVLIGQGYSAGSLIVSRLVKPDWLHCEVRYLLLSHPLSVSWALNIFRGARIQSCLHEIARNSKVLAIWGTNDQFTGVERYRQWDADMSSAFPDNWKSVEIAGADHFWSSLDSVYSSFIEWIT
ncbi:hypothetical protein E3P99_03615 [Wallemia hederae]|uniref:Alpha/beta hydrolase n=1 Tax=Wallemia hederae TaxID=1540922 RepID=A0A4T0FEH1_9BASI|nr:hypothetical protein E3P99_03615 [Wallemia hederae]